jgi:hypothetical protein
MRAAGRSPASSFFLFVHVFLERLNSRNKEENTVQVLVEGQTIRHDQYGVGIVTESNVERTTIDFDDHGLKKFVTSIWTAELIGEPPAEKPVRRRGRRKSVKKAS